MTSQELLVIMQNRLVFLEDSKKRAISTGNLEQLEVLDRDIFSTMQTIKDLSDILE